MTELATVLDACPEHPSYRLGKCQPCFRQANGVPLDFLARVDAACDTRFPPRYRLAAVDNPEVMEWVHLVRSNPYAAPSLLLLGPTGSGKTHQGYAALRAALQQRAPLRWDATTAADMYASLRPSTSYSPEERLRRYRDVDVLLIDDLGIGKSSEWVEETTYRILGGRYDAVIPTIITSNLDPAGLRDAVGDRIASRLNEMCVRVVIDAPDRRRVKAVA